MSEKLTSPNKPCIVYEVNARLEPALRDTYLDWLRPHAEQMLTFKGFRKATILTASESAASEEDKKSFNCTVHYLIDSAEDLDHYLAHHAATMRADGIALFGDKLHTSRRIFQAHDSLQNRSLSNSMSLADNTAQRSAHEDTTVTDPQLGTCLNCGSAFTGQYCHVCGQRQQRKLISVTELIGDLVRDFTEWDSRFWRTLWPLLTKPGKLTVAYLEGQRMYYSPPLRMYLITSLLFFLIVTVQSQFSLMKMDISESVNRNISLNSDVDAVPGNNTPAPPPSDSTLAANTEVAEVTQVAETVEVAADTEDTDINDVLRKASENCAALDIKTGTKLEKTVTARARQVCLKITTPDGLKNFASDLIDNAPKTFILLLPLMALAHKFLYLFSGRYYVEHLLLFVHGYSFIFLLSIILIVLSKLSDAAGFAHFGWIVMLSLIYMAYYFLKSMRVVYQQSRALTVFKWLVSMLIYYFLVAFIFILFTVLTAVMIT